MITILYFDEIDADIVFISHIGIYHIWYIHTYNTYIQKYIYKYIYKYIFRYIFLFECLSYLYLYIYKKKKKHIYT